MISTQFRSFFLGRLRLLLISCLLAPVFAFAASGDIIEFRADSPQRYQVVQGDTLWDISERFLEAPWLWPEVWQSNPQISNPDLIYPGDTIVLVYVDGEPMLTLDRGQASNRELAVIRLSPQVRREAILSPIPMISLGDINAYLSKNRVAEVSEIENAPTLLGSQSGRRFSSKGDIVFAAGTWSSEISTYDIVRPERELMDRATGELVAYEAVIVGTATIISRDNNQATLIIDGNIEEVDVGDRLMPGVSSIIASTLFPTPPPFQLIDKAQVVDVEFGKSFGGANDNILLNVGRTDGMRAGHLLTVQKPDHEIADGRKTLTFDGEKFGRVLIYKVFRDHSLAFILSSDRAVFVNDKVVTP